MEIHVVYYLPQGVSVGLFIKGASVLDQTKLHSKTKDRVFYFKYSIKIEKSIIIDA